MRAGTRRPKETVIIRLGRRGGGGVQCVKVSSWWRGRAREVARGLMGTVLLLFLLDFFFYSFSCLEGDFVSRTWGGIYIIIFVYMGLTNLAVSSSNPSQRACQACRQHLYSRSYPALSVGVCAGRVENGC